MDQIFIKNPEIKKRYHLIINSYYYDVPIELNKLVRLTIINFKKYSNNEGYIILSLLYGLLFFKKIDFDNELLTIDDKKNLHILMDTYKYEIQGDKEKLIQSMVSMDNDLFTLKMIVKYTILVFQEKHGIKIVDNNTEYYKSIGYIIPLLTLKEFNLLGFFQDEYFKHLFPVQWTETRELYLKNINDVMTPGKYIINIVNNLSELMSTAGVMGIISLRKKSYFSLYNKYQRKHDYKGFDAIGARIIFNNLVELQKFVNEFEIHYGFEKKKDYILTPKVSGYQSIHYSFMTPFRANEIYVELQLRTLDMNNSIYNDEKISHFTYTIKKNKWASSFKEVQEGYDLILKYMKNKEQS